MNSTTEPAAQLLAEQTGHDIHACRLMADCFAEVIRENGYRMPDAVGEAAVARFQRKTHELAKLTLQGMNGARRDNPNLVMQQEAEELLAALYDYIAEAA